MTPVFDLIIPTFKNEPLIQQCLANVDKYSPDSRTIVVDNGNEMVYQDTPALVVIPCSENLQFTKGTNLGIARSTAPYIVMLNNDVLVYEHWLENMRWVLDNHPTCGAVGVLTSPNAKSWQNVTYNTLESHLRGVNLPTVFQDSIDHAALARQLDEVKKHQSIECSMVGFFCTMFRRETIAEFGYLDEGFACGFGGDDAYCSQLIKGGKHIRVALDTYVYHGHRTTFKQLYTDAEISRLSQSGLGRYYEQYGK